MSVRSSHVHSSVEEEVVWVWFGGRGVCVCWGGGGGGVRSELVVKETVSCYCGVIECQSVVPALL